MVMSGQGGWAWGKLQKFKVLNKCPFVSTDGWTDRNSNSFIAPSHLGLSFFNISVNTDQICMGLKQLPWKKCSKMTISQDLV